MIKLSQAQDIAVLFPGLFFTDFYAFKARVNATDFFVPQQRFGVKSHICHYSTFGIGKFGLGRKDRRESPWFRQYGFMSACTCADVVV